MNKNIENGLDAILNKKILSLKKLSLDDLNYITQIIETIREEKMNHTESYYNPYEISQQERQTNPINRTNYITSYLPTARTDGIRTCRKGNKEIKNNVNAQRSSISPLETNSYNNYINSIGDMPRFGISTRAERNIDF
jgi:hypothetical protein